MSSDRHPAVSDSREERMLIHERALWSRGFRLLAGIDEAGRGPLAGPVVAAAVVLPVGVILPGVDDSKKLSPRRREELADLIRSRALAVATGIVPHERIDEINILNATLQAMRQAVESLGLRPDHLLVDGNRSPDTGIPCVAIVDGDALSSSIAAASIIAKVTRDRLMVEYDRQYPGYGFARHKGYGTREHREAIERLGFCPIHRRSFAVKPVTEERR
jgi:ribonuclease HII